MLRIREEEVVDKVASTSVGDNTTKLGLDAAVPQGRPPSADPCHFTRGRATRLTVKRPIIQVGTVEILRTGCGRVPFER